MTDVDGRQPTRVVSASNLTFLVLLTCAGVALAASAVIGVRKASTVEITLPSGEKVQVSREQADAINSDPGLLDQILGENNTGIASGPVGTSGPQGNVGPRTTAGPGGNTGGTGGNNNPVAVGSREGVHPDHIEIGVHAPLTIGGAPLNLAEDPVTGLKGYITHVNRNNGINGRKIRMFLEDDRYETNPGGTQAANTLVNEVKPFIISGTLGVDQINVVVKKAREAGIPYMAVGGPEPEWKDIGMYQVGSSYDQYISALSKYICMRVAPGGDLATQPQRVGTTALDSPFMLPVEGRFVASLKRDCGIDVDPAARTKVLKPTQQDTYNDQRIRLQGAYNGLGVNLLVPLQDPVTTSRQIAEWTARSYTPKWTFSNFAHDGETVLTLTAKQWVGVRGLSGGCHYQYENYRNNSLCARMDKARDQWVNLGPVTYDENVSGSKGSKSNSYTYDQASYDTDGNGGVSAYQLVSFWLGALRAIGNDPTREGFINALNNYNGYNDLITSPLTFKNSPNIMRGATGVVVIEGLANDKYRQVADVTPGLTNF